MKRLKLIYILFLIITLFTGAETLYSQSSIDVITTIAGTGATGHNGGGIAATGANLSFPVNLTSDNAGNIYIADYYNRRYTK